MLRCAVSMTIRGRSHGSYSRSTTFCQVGRMRSDTSTVRVATLRRCSTGSLHTTSTSRMSEPVVSATCRHAWRVIVSGLTEIGNDDMPGTEIVLCNRVGDQVAGRANVASQRSGGAQRLLDDVDTQIRRFAHPRDLARKRCLPRTGKPAEHDQHLDLIVTCPRCVPPAEIYRSTHPVRYHASLR